VEIEKVFRATMRLQDLNTRTPGEQAPLPNSRAPPQAALFE